MMNSNNEFIYSKFDDGELMAILENLTSSKTKIKLMCDIDTDFSKFKKGDEFDITSKEDFVDALIKKVNRRK